MIRSMNSNQIRILMKSYPPPPNYPPIPDNKFLIDIILKYNFKITDEIENIINNSSPIFKIFDLINLNQKLKNIPLFIKLIENINHHLEKNKPKFIPKPRPKSRPKAKPKSKAKSKPK